MKKPLPESIKNEKGTAIFAAIMLLILASGLGLLAFHVSSSELQISTYSGRELGSTYLAESGVEQVLSWVADPARSPDPSFFANVPTRRCSREKTAPDFQLSEALINNTNGGPFTELIEIGRIVDLRLYKPSHPEGLCTIQSSAISGKGVTKVVRVEISKNPLPPITAAVQGWGETGVSAPIWGHWGQIRYTGSVRIAGRLARVPMINPSLSPHPYPYTEEGPNEDRVTEIHVEKQIEGLSIQTRPNVYENDTSVLLDSVTPNRLNEIKSYIKAQGGYYVVSPSGRLEQNGIDRGEFDDVFGSPGEEHALAWIDVLPGYSNAAPVRLGRKNYKGYFIFAGSIEIQESVFQEGMTVQAQSHPWSDTHPYPMTLNDIRLDGFFYALGSIELRGAFSAYGALYAGQGFTGPGAENLQVWYNNRFRLAAYEEIPRVIRLKGTWYLFPTPNM